MFAKITTTLLILTSLLTIFGKQTVVATDSVKIYYNCNATNLSKCQSQNLSDNSNPIYNNCNQYQYYKQNINSNATGLNTIFNYKGQKAIIRKCLSYYTSARTLDLDDQSCRLSTIDSILAIFTRDEIQRIKNCQKTFVRLQPLDVEIEICKNIFTTKNLATNKISTNRSREFDEMTFFDCNKLYGKAVRYSELKLANLTKTQYIPLNPDRYDTLTSKPTVKKPVITGISATLVKYNLGSRLTNNCYQQLEVKSAEQVKRYHPNLQLKSRGNYSLLYTQGDLAEKLDRHYVGADIVYVPQGNVKRVTPADCKAKIIYRK
jgi:hypothetical protein